MKLKVKRLLSLICALLMLVFAMSACGDKAKDTNSNESTSSKTPENTVIAVDPDIDPNSKYADPNWSPYASMPESSKGATVRYATWLDHTQTECAIAYANIYSDIGIKVEPYLIPQSGYINTIMVKSASGDIPDVFVTNEGDQAFPISLQIAAPINKVSTVDLNDPRFDQTYLKTSTIEGNTYYVQTIGSPHANGNFVFYNKTLFSDNGFKSPEDYYNEGTWTWDAMLKCLKDIESLGTDYYGAHVEMDILSGGAGVSFIKYNYQTHTFSNGTTDVRLKNVYEWYVDAKAQGLLDGSMNKFAQGKCGIAIRGVYGLRATGYWKDMDPDDVGFTYLPSFEEGETSYISAIYGGHGIVEKAPNADAAGYFIRYWLDPSSYDLDNTFLSIEAGQFYYKLVDSTADQKYFNHDAGCAILSGQKGQNVFMNPAMNVSSAAQVNTKLQEVSPLVDIAVDAANKLINDKIAADKKNYK